MDPGEFLDIQVDQLIRCVRLIAARSRPRTVSSVASILASQPLSVEDRLHRRGRQPDLEADMGRTHLGCRRNTSTRSRIGWGVRKGD